MARLEDIPEPTRTAVANLACPAFETAPFVWGPKLSERRVAIVSSAALIHRGDKPFPFGSGEYRAVPGTWENADILISHVSINFDRAGFQRDINVVFPIDRLRDLAAEGVIGSVAAAARRLAWPASRPRPGRLLPRRSWTAFCRPCRISIRPLWRCGFWRTI